MSDVNYLEPGELKDTLALTGTAFAEDDIPRAIGAASRYIDEFCGRKFSLDTTDQTRYYSNLHPDDFINSRYTTLIIDDITELTSLSTSVSGDGVYGQVWTVNKDFILEPTNAVADGYPYESIRIHPNGRYRFSANYPNSIQVIGKFGWPWVPDPVKQACTIMATRLLKRSREAAFGVISVGMEGPLTRVPRLQYDPDIGSLLAPYSRSIVFM